jgi:hypothetical protein
MVSLKYASIQISFAAKEYPLIVFLRLIVGHGSIAKVKHSAAYIYTVNNLEGIIKVASIINGLIRTPKIMDLNTLILYLNIKSLNALNIVAIPLDISPLSSNA